MILIVDDHPDIRRALCVLLKRYGFEVCPVDSGRRALEWMGSRVPHCVLLDYNMPEMNGLDVLRAIRSDPRLQAVHVILFTAQHGGELKRAAFAAGADAFVVKGSLDFAELERAVGRYCRPSKEPRPIGDAVGPPPSPRAVG